MSITTTCQTTLYQLPDEADECLTALVAVLDGTQHTFRAIMFNFSHPVLLAAIERMYQRGVDTKIILDWTQFRGPGELRAMHAFLQIVPPADVAVGTSEVGHQFNHDKLGVADGRVVIDGSTNWSLSAFKETNQARVSISPELATAYQQQFDAHWAWTLATEQKYQASLKADSA